jgi:hypothetical protein
MSQEQNKTISGVVYDTFTELSQEYRHNVMPRIGQTVEFEDGRKFVFGSSVLAMPLGTVARAPAHIASAVSGAHVAGVTEVRVIEASIDASAWSSGQITFGNLGTYKIKSNSASATVDAVANTVIVLLYDALRVALTDTLVTDVAPYRPSGLLVGTIVGDTVGVALVATDVTAVTGATNTFQWFQYSGPGHVLGAGTVGDALQADDGGDVVIQTAGNCQVGIMTGAAVAGVIPACLTMRGGC